MEVISFLFFKCVHSACPTIDHMANACLPSETTLKHLCSIKVTSLHHFCCHSVSSNLVKCEMTNCNSQQFLPCLVDIRPRI